MNHRTIAIVLLFGACAPSYDSDFDFTADFVPRALSEAERARHRAAVDEAERLYQQRGTTSFSLALDNGGIVAASSGAGILSELYPRTSIDTFTEAARTVKQPSDVLTWLTAARNRLKSPGVVGYESERGLVVLLTSDTSFAIGPGTDFGVLRHPTATYVAYGQLSNQGIYDMVVLSPPEQPSTN